MTEWEEFFVISEDNLGYWFPDLKQRFKYQKDETKKLKLWQTPHGSSTNAALSCPRTRKLKQSSFNSEKTFYSMEATNGTKSMAQWSIAIDRKEKDVRASDPSEATESTNDMKSHIEASQIQP